VENVEMWFESTTCSKSLTFKTKPVENFENAIESIGQALFELFEENIPAEAKNLLNQLDSAYVVVTWPDVQELMEEDWFDEEAILDVDGKFGDSAYFIPLKRIL
jgi:hypothetical protein